MVITAGMIAKAAATALSNEKLRKGIGWGLVAVLSPVILLIAALCSIGTGGADHNNQAVAAAFYGTSYSTEVPMAFRSHIEEMRTAFSLLDSAVASVNGRTEGGNSLDPIRVKAVFYALCFGEDAPGRRAANRFVECFYTTEELIRALEPLRGQDIPLTVHMRQEGAGVCDSIEEMLLVARELRVPLHISHLKAMGRDNWGKKIPRALELLHRAKEEGLDVGCDVYPYTAGSTQLLHILPPEFLEGGMDAVVRRLADPHERETLAHRIEDGGGFDDIAKLAGWDGIFLSSLHCPEDAPLLGKSIAQEAAMEHKSPLDACCDLLIREHCQVTMIDFMAAEEDIAAILRSPLSCLISDATYPTEGMPHPRVYGSCTRLLQHFVREQGVLTLEQGVHKLTQAPAQALRLAGKGVIAVGADADLCVFDPAALTERGTYQDPCQTALGMDAVLVAGRLAVKNGELTGVKAGTLIRK